MKRTISILGLLCIFLGICAKTSYIPSYFTGISIEDSGQLVKDTSFLNELSISALDERFTIMVLHDSLSEARIKAIKRQKAVVVLSTIAATAGALSAFTSAVSTPVTPLDAKWQSINYANGVGLAGSATYSAMAAQSNVNDLHRFPINIFIHNNTNKELYVNDMARGLIWYIRAQGELLINVGNPEINRFRIAYADSTEPQVSYVIIEAANELLEANVEFEDDTYRYYNRTERMSGSQYIVSFIRKNKQTQERDIIQLTEKEARELKNSSKKK